MSDSPLIRFSPVEESRMAAAEASAKMFEGGAAAPTERCKGTERRRWRR